MKKTFSIMLTFVFMFLVTFSANASGNENRIYSDSIFAEKGNTIDIPIRIENNTGIMGFAIDIIYDSSVLTPVSVECSGLLSGMMNDSIDSSTSEIDSFRVLYTGTEDFNFNGTIFTVSFAVSDSENEITSIDLSYSAEDTFNESFEEVELNCESITVLFNGSDNEPTEPEPGDNDTKLSIRIKNWATGLKSPWNTIMSIIVAPVVFVLQLFGR